MWQLQRVLGLAGLLCQVQLLVLLHLLPAALQLLLPLLLVLIPLVAAEPQCCSNLHQPLLVTMQQHGCSRNLHSRGSSGRKSSCSVFRAQASNRSTRHMSCRSSRRPCCDQSSSSSRTASHFPLMLSTSSSSRQCWVIRWCWLSSTARTQQLLALRVVVVLVLVIVVVCQQGLVRRTSCHQAPQQQP